MTRIFAIGLVTLTACAPSVPDSGPGGVDAFGSGATDPVPVGGLTTTQSDIPAAPIGQSNPDPVAAVAPPPGATRYECDTGATLFADVTGRSATITFDTGDAVRMSRVQGASVRGNTYAGGGWIWFVDGQTAVLTDQGGQKNCRVSAL